MFPLRLSYALTCAAAVALGLAVSASPHSEPPFRHRGVLLEVPGHRAVLLTKDQAEDIASGEQALPMPGRRSVRVGMAEITYKLDRDGAQRALGRLARSGGRVRVDERPVQVMIDAPPTGQASRRGLARRWFDPVELTGAAPESVFGRLLGGRPVLAWVRPRSGRPGAHAFLLVGLAGSRIVLEDPLTGARQNWSRGEFKRRWVIAGRRALSA